MNKTKFIGLIIGIIFLIATCLLPSPESLNNKAWLTLGVAILWQLGGNRSYTLYHATGF